MHHSLATPLCARLGIDVPIISAPMGPAISTPALVAAVSNAGGLGMLSFGALPPDALRRLVQQIRTLTDRPFGVNFILAFPVDAQVEVCLEERVPVLSFFWGDVTPFVEPAHRAGAVVLDQVGSARAARRSVEAGTDVVIAQGIEAGGHVIGETATMALVPTVVDAIDPVPVVAAGGIAGGRGLAAALALGAQGVAMGTRFLASSEAAAHDEYKQRVIDATEADTVHTTLFDRDWPAPHRVLRTPYVNQRLNHPGDCRDAAVVAQTMFGGRHVPVVSGMSLPPDRTTTGDIGSMALLAGQSAGQVTTVISAGEIVRTCVIDAVDVLTRLTATAAPRAVSRPAAAR